MKSRAILVLTLLAMTAFTVASAAARPAPQTVQGDPLDPRTYEPHSRPFLVAHATGVQKYTCQPDGTWLFTDPEATLFKTKGKPKPIGSHFLNFVTGRPVWMLKDGSSVEAARKASAANDTSGGVAPAGTCAPGDHIAVPYAADYFFWRSAWDDLDD
jgi:hypothetical protein